MEEDGESRSSEAEAEDEGTLHLCVSLPKKFFEILVGLVRGYGC